MDNENLAPVIKVRYTLTAGQFKVYFRSVLSATLQANIISFKTVTDVFIIELAITG